MKTRIALGILACLLLLVCWTVWWRINFINKHPDEFMNCGMPPIWDYHYWPVVGNDEDRPFPYYPRMVPSTGVSWPLMNGSKGAAIVTNKPF